MNRKVANLKKRIFYLKLAHFRTIAGLDYHVLDTLLFCWVGVLVVVSTLAFATTNIGV